MAQNDGYLLTEDAARRIAAAVVGWEREGGQPPAALEAATSIRPWRFIKFVLIDNLTVGSTARAYQLLHDSAAGVEMPNLTAGPLVVSDTYGICRGRKGDESLGLIGSCGLAIHHHEVDRWDIVLLQPMVMMIDALVNATSGVKPSDSRIPIDTATVCQPIGGLLNQMPTDVSNRYDQSLDDDDRVLVLWDEAAEDWFGFRPGGDGKIKWAQVQSGFANAGGDLTREVGCKKCLWDGTGVGDDITLNTPIRANKDTALFDNYLVGYQTEPDDKHVIVTDCWDDPIGTVKAWDTADAIRDGWEELTAAAGRFLVGVEAAEDWDDPGDTGGADLNQLAGGLQDHPEQAANCLGTGVDWKLHTKLDGTTGSLDHLLGDDTPSLAPPWYAVRWIKRTS